MAGCALLPLAAPSAADRLALDRPLVLPPIQDGRTRFREILAAVTRRHGPALGDYRPVDRTLWRLPGEPSPTGRPVDLDALPRPPFLTVLVPGLLSECIGDDLQPFDDAVDHVAALGFPTRRVRTGGRASSGSNAPALSQQLLAIATSSGLPLVLVGHSKGAVDVLETLASYPELQPRIAALVAVAAPIAGSPLADEDDSWYARLLRNFPSAACPKGDHAGLTSLATGYRKRWLADHRLPATIRYYSLAAIALDGDISAALQPFRDELSKIDVRNDGQVLYQDAVIPGSVLMGYVRADHFAVAVPFSRRRPLLSATLIHRNAFPREVLLESMVRFVAEDLATVGDGPRAAGSPAATP